MNDERDGSADVGSKGGGVGRSSGFATLRIASISDFAALFGILGGCLYLYDRAYNVAFLSSFGLEVGVVPMSAQDAIVDGLEGVAIHILLLWVPVATAFLLYFASLIASDFFEAEKEGSRAVETVPRTR